MTHMPAAGTLLHLGRKLSPQWNDRHPIPFRLTRVRVDLVPACDGWIYLDGYELDNRGRATEHRTVLVIESQVMKSVAPR